MSDATKPTCGIVMPISSIDGCTEAHWTDVHDILTEAIEDAGFEGNLVSNADDVGIIQKRIIENLYDNPIVVCDVSGKNPNVMFELGIRLAFDRPTIIVKDDKTTYSFDTSPIEHLEYPRDLRFGRIVDFKEKLSDKIQKTHERASADPAYTTFLKHFGEFKVAKLDKKEVSGQEFILDELKSLRLAFHRLEQTSLTGKRVPLGAIRPRLDFCVGNTAPAAVEEFAQKLRLLPGVADVEIRELAARHRHLKIVPKDGANREDIDSAARVIIPSKSRGMRAGRK